jgi:hypothetical protein
VSTAPLTSYPATDNCIVPRDACPQASALQGPFETTVYYREDHHDNALRSQEVQRSKAEEFNASYLRLIEGKSKPILNLLSRHGKQEPKGWLKEALFPSKIKDNAFSNSKMWELICSFNSRLKNTSSRDGKESHEEHLANAFNLARRSVSQRTKWFTEFPGCYVGLNLDMDGQSSQPELLALKMSY